MRMGKNTPNVTRSTFICSVVPKRSTASGRTAITGIVFRNSMTRKQLRYAMSLRPMTVPASTPPTAPRAKPMAVPSRVSPTPDHRWPV
jgi:hypothetical protein